MKTPEDSARLYISEEYHERLLKEIGPADSLVERVFLDGVKFGYEWAKQQHAKQLTQAYPSSNSLDFPDSWNSSNNSKS